MSSTKFISPTLSGLNRALEISQGPWEMTGSTNPSLLAWLVTRPQHPARPRVIICPNDKVARLLAADLQSVQNIKPILLDAFDESPYSGLYPSRYVFQSRTHFMWRALHSKPDDIFIASIEGVLQKTIPRHLFKQFELTLKKGDEVDPQLLLEQLVQAGYEPTPIVEDGGTFSRRGDILDIFSPAHHLPLRIEFFGDQIESIRLFEPETQRSEEELTLGTVIPAREILFLDEVVERGKKNIKKFCDEHDVSKEKREILTDPLSQKIYSHGIDYWLTSFYDDAASPLEAFSSKPLIYWLDEQDIVRSADGLAEGFQSKYRDQIQRGDAVPDPDQLYAKYDELLTRYASSSIHVQKIHIDSLGVESSPAFSVKTFDTSDFSTLVRAARESKKDFFEPAVHKLKEWRDQGLFCFIWAGTQTQAQRVKYLFETHNLLSELVEGEALDWELFFKQQELNRGLVHVLSRPLGQGFRTPDERIVFIREEDLFGGRSQRETHRSKGTLEQRTNTLSFGDLNPGDFVVHSQHGVGVYEGFKKIAVQDVESEFLQLRYKDNDKLYLPVYRISQIQKYTSPGGSPSVDKLGSTSWQKAKVKVRNSLKDLANELLELYAKRQSTPGFAFSAPDTDFHEFEATFPYDETPDQAKAINDVLKDMQDAKPMDRLVCGDVGFGKTEVAIRAAYKAVQDKKQVAVLVPTTVLAFQHFQNFKKRFADSAVNVAMVSRFVTPQQIKKDLVKVSEGKVDILIGTHRLISKDVVFKDLGLLVVDEEQKFGVTHKERIKKLKSQVDVLTLSATPIPRTLNMSLMGVRDLSVISTPPEDRLAIRTFINRFDEETIRKAIMGEIQRGGQVFFLHNRVQSINGFADQVKSVVPEARIRVAHGQMDEELLEKTMLDFYNHEFDVLICTTIIESGLDIPSANTIIIDRADTFGLSQLYQLRGRVGRSKERAYAYLLIPPQGVVDKTAQERLKIIQENTELGSGFQIAHHDLELRGGGNILGDDQSGEIATVGYELYMELLEQALAGAKGDIVEEDVEPEINLRIPALIPDKYIEDIRIRLAYYKALSDIQDETDLDRIEHELVDRFGQLPEQVTNLFGVMLIRKLCKDLGVRDISSGPKNVSLLFSNSTKVVPNKLIKLASTEVKKYQITPDQKLIIRLNSTTWPRIAEELKGLKKLLI